jgi:hypothetical protein
LKLNKEKREKNGMILTLNGNHYSLEKYHINLSKMKILMNLYRKIIIGKEDKIKIGKDY